MDYGNMEWNPSIENTVPKNYNKSVYIDELKPFSANALKPNSVDQLKAERVGFKKFAKGDRESTDFFQKSQFVGLQKTF